MKRIAVQFFGHLRTFDKTYESFFKHVVEPNMRDGYEIDIFIHTWDEREHSTISFRNPKGEVLTNSSLTQEYIQLAEHVYKPKKMLVEKQKEHEEKIFFEKLYHSKKSLRGLLNMVYTIHTSSIVRNTYEKEARAEYDWVIVTRPDIEFFSPLRLHEFLEIYEKNNISIPENAIFYATKIFARSKVDDIKFIGGSDLVYFGKPTNIDTATNLYINWYNTNKCTDVIDPEMFYSFESWYMYYWIKQGLVPIAIDYVTIRDFFPRFNRTKLSFSNIASKIRRGCIALMKYILPYNFIVWLKNKND